MFEKAAGWLTAAVPANPAPADRCLSLTDFSRAGLAFATARTRGRHCR